MKVVYLMMQHIQGTQRHQLQMSSLEDKIGIENPVRFIDAFVEHVSFYLVGFKVQTIENEENIMGKLRDINGWLRNRLRYCIWHDWKKPERKRKNLIRLGVDQDHAYAWSRTRKGGWAIAQSPILGTTITLKRLKQKGYVSLTEIYIQLNPSLCEPPST
jgi:hypothetical protein